MFKTVIFDEEQLIAAKSRAKGRAVNCVGSKDNFILQEVPKQPLCYSLSMGSKKEEIKDTWPDNPYIEVVKYEYKTGSWYWYVIRYGVVDAYMYWGALQIEERWKWRAYNGMQIRGLFNRLHEDHIATEVDGRKVRVWWRGGLLFATMLPEPEPDKPERKPKLQPNPKPKQEKINLDKRPGISYPIRDFTK